MPKVFKCSACGGQHKRPVGVKCQMQNTASADSVVDAGLSIPGDTNTQILSALTAVSSRLMAIEQQIESTEEQLQNGSKLGSQEVNLATGGASTT